MSGGMSTRLVRGRKTGRRSKDIAEWVDREATLVVSECSAFKKVEHINSDDSEYLQFCLGDLARRAGVLLTIGCSFDNDEHILTAILHDAERWKALYFGCFELETSSTVHKLKAKIMDLCQSEGINIASLPDLFFYDTTNLNWIKPRPSVSRLRRIFGHG